MPYRLLFYLELEKEMINLKQGEETRNAKQFYQEYEFRDNVLDRISQLKFI